MTLAEIAIGSTILMLLGWVVVPGVSRRLYRAKLDELAQEVAALRDAARSYHADVGSFLPLNDIGEITSSEATPAYEHLVAGDGQPGWRGPYLESVADTSPLGGRYDIDVLTRDAATIDVGTQAGLGSNYQPVLERLNELFDGDDSLGHGVVWGDANGIHVGLNYARP